MKQWIPVLAALLVALAASASDKTDALRKLRDKWSTQRFYTAETRSGAELAGLLDNNGSFANLRELETEFKKNNYGRKKFDQWELQQKVLNRLLVPAFEQLKRISGDLADGKIPEAGRAARGTAIVNILPLEPDERVSAMLTTREFTEDYLMMVTRGGTVKRLALPSVVTARKAGIRVITLDEGD